MQLYYLINYNFIHSSIHTYIHPFIMHICIQFIHPFIHPFIHLFIHPFIHLFIHSSIQTYHCKYIRVIHIRISVIISCLSTIQHQRTSQSKISSKRMNQHRSTYISSLKYIYIQSIISSIKY